MEQQPAITIPGIERVTGIVKVRGTAPLIVHRWSEKAKATMLEKMQSTKTTTRSKKDPRDPAADYENSKYRLDDGRDGFPAVAFKSAIVDAARLFDGVKMTELRAIISVVGEGREMLVPIIGEARMREDTVRVGMQTADLRYRAEYWPWEVALEIRFLPTMISAESLLALVDAAGVGGVGEWRPGKAKTGVFGTFEVIA